LEDEIANEDDIVVVVVVVAVAAVGRREWSVVGPGWRMRFRVGLEEGMLRAG
jgi:hypothetical protein